jgi:hypothetical protein
MTQAHLTMLDHRLPFVEPEVYATPVHSPQQCSLYLRKYVGSDMGEKFRCEACPTLMPRDTCYS